MQAAAIEQPRIHLGPCETDAGKNQSTEKTWQRSAVGRTHAGGGGARCKTRREHTRGQGAPHVKEHLKAGQTSLRAYTRRGPWRDTLTEQHDTRGGAHMSAHKHVTHKDSMHPASHIPQTCPTTGPPFKRTAASSMASFAARAGMGASENTLPSLAPPTISWCTTAAGSTVGNDGELSLAACSYCSGPGSKTASSSKSDSLSRETPLLSGGRAVLAVAIESAGCAEGACSLLATVLSLSMAALGSCAGAGAGSCQSVALL
jgi:hypothetical protein